MTKTSGTIPLAIEAMERRFEWTGSVPAVLFLMALAFCKVAISGVSEAQH